jgi:16S rRNA U516 pseudouridylate synthase RsuA-like enzyme
MGDSEPQPERQELPEQIRKYQKEAGIINPQTMIDPKSIVSKEYTMKLTREQIEDKIETIRDSVDVKIAEASLRGIKALKELKELQTLLEGGKNGN